MKSQAWYKPVHESDYTKFFWLVLGGNLLEPELSEGLRDITSGWLWQYGAPIKTDQGTSLEVQWLRLSTPIARGVGSIPGLGTACCKAQPKKNNKKTPNWSVCGVTTQGRQELRSGIRIDTDEPFGLGLPNTPVFFSLKCLSVNHTAIVYSGMAQYAGEPRATK